MKTLLTRQQTNIVNVIRTSLVNRGFPPSIREIGEAVGLSSSSTVHNHLKTLETKGVLRRNPSKPRSIELVDRPVPTSPLVIYHRQVVDKVREWIADLEPIATVEAAVHEFNSAEEVHLAQIGAETMLATYKKFLSYLQDISPLGGLQ